MASAKGHAEVVKLLVDKGADEIVKASNSATALIMASIKGHAEIVNVLVDKGADLNVKMELNGVAWTALKIAKEMGLTNIVDMLKRTGTKD